MRLASVRCRMAVLAGLWLASAGLLRGGAPDDLVESQLKLLQDTTRADEQRAAARSHMINIIVRGDKTAVERLLKLGSDTTSDRVRLDVAYILAQTRNRKSIVPPDYTQPAIELLSKWLDGKDADAAVRLWAGEALAVTQDASVLPLLKEKALAPGSDPVIRVAVARALAGWRGENLATAVVPLLAELLTDKDAEMRIAGCDALRLTELDNVATVDPLLDVAKGDKEEKVWRAAVRALSRLGGGTLLIPAVATDAERQQRLQAWENVWRKKKRPEAKEKG